MRSMSIAEVLKVCAGLYLAVILLDWLRSRRHKRFLLELLPLIVLLMVEIGRAHV